MPEKKFINEVQEVSWHRNGVAGVGFHAVRFTADIDDVSDEDAKRWHIQARPGRKDARWLAIVFDAPGECAVICLDLIETVGVKFGGNSWRGDHYEPELRHAIETMQSSGSIRMGPFGLPTT